MIEQWKDIKDYPGYQVSNIGNVRTNNKITSSARFPVRKWKNRVLKKKIDKYNSERVELWNENGHKTFLVHRLVANAFLGECEDSTLTVNHKDGNRLNNSVDNLEWMTRADNIRHGFRTGLYTAQKSCRLTINNEEYAFRSMEEATRFIGRGRGYISEQLKRGGKIKTKSGAYVEVQLCE